MDRQGRWMDGWMDGGLGSEGGEGLRYKWLGGKGRTRTLERHKLTMTYRIGVSVTCMLAAVAALSPRWGWWVMQSLYLT